MPNYRRPAIAGGTCFITQATYQRYPWLCREIARHALRTAINQVRQPHPFVIDAFVLLPDHFHCLWTLPQTDNDLSTRLRLIKTYVTRHYGTLSFCLSGIHVWLQGFFDDLKDAIVSEIRKLPPRD